MQGALVFVGRGFDIFARDITDGDGKYALQGLAPGKYLVKARFSTLPIALSKDEVAIQAGQTVTTDLTFAAGRRLEGAVLDQEDEPIPGVEVLGPGGAQTRTNSKGEFVLDIPRGAAQIRLKPADEDLMDVRKVRGDQDRVVWRWERRPRGEIKARIQSIHGRKAINGVVVHLIPKGNLRATVLEMDMVRLMQRLQQTSGASWLESSAGKIELDNVAIGDYGVFIYARGFEPWNKDVRIAEGALDLGNVDLRPGAPLRGRVVDESGKAVPRAKVLLGPLSFLSVEEERLHELTDAEGFFEISGVGTTQTSKELTIGAAGYAPISATIEVPKDLLAKEPRVFRLRKGSVVPVLVVDQDDQRQPYRTVHLLKRGASQWVVLRRGRTDENGEVEFEDLGPGFYQVRENVGSLRSRSDFRVKQGSAGRLQQVKLRTGR